MDNEREIRIRECREEEKYIIAVYENEKLIKTRIIPKSVLVRAKLPHGRDEYIKLHWGTDSVLICTDMESGVFEMLVGIYKDCDNEDYDIDRLRKFIIELGFGFDELEVVEIPF